MDEITIPGLINRSSSKTIKELQSETFEWTSIPASQGVYIAVYTHSSKPTFLLPRGTGGWFKGENPNVTVEILDKKWVDFKANKDQILYIGKAGRKNTLRKRVRSFIYFGKGKPVAHRGGKYIWQIANTDAIEIYYATVEDPEYVEKTLIEEFKTKHGKLPFANLIMPHG